MTPTRTTLPFDRVRGTKSTSNNKQQKRTRRTIKRVRFLHSRSGEIKLEHIPTTKRVARSLNDLWFTKEELVAFKKREAATCCFFLAISPNYQSSLETLLKECCRTSNNTNFHADNQHYSEEAVQVVVNHDARGLEKQLLGRLYIKSVPYYRKMKSSSIKAVLDAQDDWKNIPNLTVDQVACLIAQAIKPYSQFASSFAQILAKGDHNVLVNGSYQSGTTMSLLQDKITDMETDMGQLCI